VEPKPTDAEVEVLLAAAKATRKKPSRAMWIVAIVISVVCVAGLAYGLISNWDAQPDPRAKSVAQTSSGFLLGFMVGLAAGIAIGSALALRRRH
jgi:hypothetical protein